MDEAKLLPTTSDFNKIVLDGISLIDVRAPIEFAQGAFENAVNLPLMNDDERHRIGICYKRSGSDAALKLGYKIVSGEIKQARIQAWKNHLEKFPNSYIYCFRGGKRSQISQQWIKEELGIVIPRLDGGYKAFRRFLMSESERISGLLKTIIVGGRTGSGKTILLKKLNNIIDLEGLANHRGSAFGRYIEPQPTQINFENNLAFDLIKKFNMGFSSIAIEDEGKRIGCRSIPVPIHANFYKGDLIVLETPLEQRIKNTFEEYVVNSQKKYKIARSKDPSIPEWIETIRSNIIRIKKRLGGAKCQQVLDILNKAYSEQLSSGNPELHKEWVEILLVEYYDPMYDYQISKRADTVKFRGTEEEIINYISSRSLSDLG